MTDTPPHPVPAPARGGGAGTASLVIGLVLVALSVGQQLLSYTVPFWVDGLAGYSQVSLILGAVTLVAAVVAVAGVITGVVGIQPGQPRGRLAAAAGLALSASHLIGALVGLVAPAALSLL